MDQGLLSTCGQCNATVSLEMMTRLRDLTCPNCRQSIRPIPEVVEPALVVIHGDDAGAAVALEEETSFGRAPTNTFTLREMKASRQHAVIKRSGAQFVLKDLKSANGTFVNSQLINSRVLANGDLLRIADSVFLYKNPRERTSVTSKLGARFRDGEYQTEAELKYSEPRQMLTLSGADENDVGKLQKANEKLRLIYEVTTYISSILDLERLLERILDIVFEQIPAERGAIFLVDDTGELEQRVVKKRGTEVEDRYLEISRTIIQKVRDDLASVLTTDTMQDESFSHAHSIISQGIRQAMTVPLLVHDELYGLIHIDTTRMSRAFNQDNLQLLTAISGQAAIAIKNAKLIAKIEKEIQTRSRLARYLAPELVEQVVNSQLDIEMGGQIKKVTLMFSDVRGFTPMSERISAEDVVLTLNRYFEVMVDTIFKHGGMLDKFVGDAIMAVWGLPTERPDDSLRAVRAAVEMQVMLALLDFQFVREGREPLYMGVGINTGDVISGNMGSTKRSEFTVIGSPVNLAARIESISKRHQVFISESTYRELKHHVRAIELAPTTVKGISGEIRVYCVIGIAAQDSSAVDADDPAPPAGPPSRDRLDTAFPVQLRCGSGAPIPAMMVEVTRAGAADVLLEATAGTLTGSCTIAIDICSLQTLPPIPADVFDTAIFSPREGFNLVRARLQLKAIPPEAQQFFDERLFPRG